MPYQVGDRIVEKPIGSCCLEVQDSIQRLYGHAALGEDDRCVQELSIA
jgi:hypothetical protein